MKKFVLLLIISMLVLTTVCFASSADSKLITYVTETENSVTVDVALRGEINSFAAITLGLTYDVKNLSVNADSISVGEAVSNWSTAISPLSTDENPNTGLVYMISIFDNASGKPVNIAKDTEEKILSFELTKKENAVVTADSVQLTDGKNASIVTSIQTMSNNTVTNNFDYSASPSKYITVFSPLLAENISSIKIGGYSELYPLAIGKTRQLYAENIPSDVSVKWTATGVAEVDENGLITAKSVGDATITATLENGVSADCIITVVEKEILPTAIEITNTPSLSFIGDQYVPVIKFTPEDTTDRRVEFSLSSYSNLVLNSETGATNISGNSSAVLTAKSLANENVSASVNIASANATPNDVTVASASAIVPEKLYANAIADSVYKTAFSAYNPDGKYIPTIKGFNFGDMYDVEYLINGDANGITVENGLITVSKDAPSIENLTLTVDIKNKNGTLVASATSNAFSVIAPAKNDTFNVLATEVSDGVYKADSSLSSEYVAIEFSPDVSCTVVVNGHATKATSVPFGIIPAEEGETDVTVYLHSNPLPGILGYNMNSVFKTVNFKIVK